MKILVLAGLTMVTAIGATAADAQRIGGYGAPYPVPGQQSGVATMRPPMVDAPNRPQPQSYPQRGFPARADSQRYAYPQRQGYPRSGPSASRWGGSVGGRWSGGSYAPGGWNAYRRPSRGYRVPQYWLSPDFYIGDYTAYGLSLPPQGYNWYRYYDDAVLLDGRGKVWDSRGGLDWDGGGYETGYGGEGGEASSGYGYADGGAGAAGGYGMQRPPYPSLPPVWHNGAVTTYQTGYPGYGGGTTTVVTIQPTETITTTTTEYVEESTAHYAAPRRVYRAPKRHYRRVVRRSCGCKRIVEQPIRGS